MNRGYFEGNSDWIDHETALPVLVLGYVVNRGYFRVETDQIDCESVVPVLVHSESRLHQS